MKEKIRILYAEDEAIQRALIANLLLNNDFLVDATENGIEACNLHKKGRYEIFLTDLDMPKMNGLEAAKRIRLQDNLIQIIALTSNNTEEKQNCLKNGMNAFLEKPTNTNLLIKTIKKLTESNQNN